MPQGTSPAARFQAYLTRLRIGVRIWLRVIMWSLIAWALLTTYVVWREAGVYFPGFQHAYFWRWVLCGIFLRVPVLNLITSHFWLPLDGSWYSIDSLNDWLSGPQLYQAPFSAWFGYYGARTALIPVGLIAATLFWRSRHRLDTEHLRGLQLLTAAEHQRQVNGGWLTQAYRRATGEVPGISIGSVTLPRKNEFRHFLIVGETGTGKTVLSRHILHEIQDRKESAVIYDPECEFVQEFYKPERGDVILCPTDTRAPYWDPWLEIRDGFKPIDASSLAASIIRGRPQNDTQEYFQRNARALIKGMFEAIPPEDQDKLDAFANFLKQTRDQIRAQLEHTSAPAAVIDPGAHDSGGGQGILGVADTAIEGFAYLPRRDQSDRTWSAREYAADPRGWVFLTSEVTTKAAVESIQGIWLDLITRWLRNRPIGNSRHVWIFIEEAASLGYQNEIKEVATRGRKRQISLVLSVQSISQLREIYGHDGATVLLSAPGNKVIFRIDETEMAEWGSKLLGEREIEKISMTQLAGVDVYREGVNLQAQRLIERIILPDEIKRLPDLEAYLCIGGSDRVRISIEPRYLEEHQPAFLPRTYNSTHLTDKADEQPRRVRALYDGA
jgi:type IV secretory pathway TraG/TraD family ATPase VirD4